VSSAVSHLASTSGVCPVKFCRRAFQSVSINFCDHRAAASAMDWWYQCLALLSQILLTYVSIIIITTRAVVMPKSQSTPLLG